MKYLIGFFLGVMVATAAAQAPQMDTSSSLMNVVGIIMAGESPSHKPKTIKVDEGGYVICAPR